MKKTLLTLVLTMAAIAGAVAQSITSATISYTFNGQSGRISLPASGFSTLDLSGTVAEYFKINSVTVQTNGTINDLKILVADYKSGDDPEKIDDNPLSQRGDTWYLTLGDDEGWIVDGKKSTATRYFSFYFVANEDDDNPVVYNNGGSYYSIRYKTEDKGGGGGEGGETGGNITFYDKNTATLSLGMTGGKYSNITYTYAGDGSRDISDQPGGVSSLEISGFTLRLQRASADLEIESVSVQYKVYEEGSDGQWNTLNYDFQEDEGGNILAKKYTGTTSTQDLTKGLKQGPTYVLEVMYQVVDKNGIYYFFKPSNVCKFSVNDDGGGGGEGGETGGNITFYDTYTAALTLSMTGGKESNINYMYNGDGTRNISDNPGGVNSLQISNFTLRLKRSSADLEIASVSLQYKVYEEGSDGQWNGMEFTEQEDEGGDILAKKYVGTRATQDLTKGLKQGTTYVLEVMYQVVDKSGNCYFFEPSNKGNNQYRFSVNNSGGGGGGESVRGDLNGDGEVNMQDVMFLVNKIVNGKFPDEK